MWPHVVGGHAASRRAAPVGAQRRQSRVRTPRLLRPAAGVDQPRGLFGKADAFVLGRFLGAKGLRRRHRLAAANGATARGDNVARGARRIPPRSSRVAARGAAAHAHRLSAGIGGARRLRSDVDHDRLRARCRCARRVRRSRCRRRTSATGASSSIAATAAWRGTSTRPTSCASSARSCAWAGASGRRRCSRSSWRAAVRRHGTSGPRSSGAICGSRASSATCRTAGSRPTTSARCSTSSPTSATPISAGAGRAAFRRRGSSGDGVAIHDLRTPYGPLSLFAARARAGARTRRRRGKRRAARRIRRSSGPAGRRLRASTARR